jgi:hypothetical protein
LRVERHRAAGVRQLRRDATHLQPPVPPRPRAPCPRHQHSSARPALLCSARGCRAEPRMRGCCRELCEAQQREPHTAQLPAAAPSGRHGRACRAAYAPRARVWQQSTSRLRLFGPTPHHVRRVGTARAHLKTTRVAITRARLRFAHAHAVRVQLRL